MLGLLVKRINRALVRYLGIIVIAGLDVFGVGYGFVIGVFWVGNLGVLRGVFCVCGWGQCGESHTNGIDNGEG